MNVKNLLVLSVSAILAGPALAADPPVCTVNAGPIWNQQDAEAKCPQTCDHYGPWTGQWWTTEWGKMSVCQCDANLGDFEAGPIWNNQDAQTKCPNTCQKAEGTWTGQWWTTVPGQMSVCQCAVCEPCTVATVNAGPIWNNQDAQTKCPNACGPSSAWNGQWWTTEWGKMSVCQCVTCP